MIECLTPTVPETVNTNVAPLPVIEYIAPSPAVSYPSFGLVNPQISTTSVETAQVFGSFPLFEEFVARMYNQIHQEQIVTALQAPAIDQEIPEVQVVERI